MRDITLEDTFYHLFTTRRFSTGAPFTLAGTPVVSAYEDNSITQITAGVTLGTDHDSVTGLNLLTIAATAANGFESGKSYHLVITTGTVDSVSVVGEVVGAFTIQLSAAAIDLANATDGLGAIKTDTAAILADTGTDGVVVASLAANSVTASALATDAVNEIVDQVWDEAQADHVAAGSFGEVATETAAILVDTAEIGTAGAGLTNINLPDQTMNITGDITGNLSGSVGSVTGDIGGIAANGLTADAFDTSLRDLLGILQLTTIATLASQTSFTLTAGSADNNAYIGAIAIVTDSATNAQKAVGLISAYTGATKTVTLAADPGIFTMAAGDTIAIIPAPKSLPAAVPDSSGGLATEDASGHLAVDVIEVGGTTQTAGNLAAKQADIETDTQDIQSRLPAALSAGGNMESNVAEISGDSAAADSLEALMDGTLVIQVNDAAATTTAFAADGFTEATDDHFNGRLITFVSGALQYQQTDITDYDAAGHAQGSQAFVVTALTEAPANNDFAVVH